MKRPLIIAGLILAIAAFDSFANVPGIGEDLMHDIEDATRDLDSNLLQKNAVASAQNTDALLELFAQVSDYYQQHPDAEKGQTYSRDITLQLTTIKQQISDQDFEGASQGINKVTKTCKACHSVYKS
ncbi:cytochrome c [Burkholderiaceae bacterium DAT-1]|nr:cytochrome c [Burkholderiaceae bacterium DAT-1]